MLSVRLTELRWPQVKEAVTAKAVVVVPVGATEQHGGHLPLEVDWRMAQTVAEAACQKAAEAGVPTVATPPIWTGYSPHHMDFPGTVTLSAATFTSVVREVAKSLWHHGFRKILFLNGHGGNMHLLRAAVQQLRFEDGVRAAAGSYWDFARDYIQQWRKSPLGGINHACEMETSLMLAVRPDLVDITRARDAIHPVGGDLAALGAVTQAWSFAELSEDGILGAAAMGDGQRGRELLDAIVAAVAQYIQDFYKLDWDAPRQV